MPNTILVDAPIQQQEPLPRKGKIKKSAKKAKGGNQYEQMVAGAPADLCVREYEAAQPLWVDETPTTVGPYAQIMLKTDIGKSEKVILSFLLSTGPQYRHHMSSMQNLLAQDGPEPATVKTTRKWLRLLEEKGYITSEKVNNENGGFYVYRIINLFLDTPGKNYLHNRSLKGSTLNLPAPQVETPPAVEPKKRITDKQDKVRALAQHAVQRTGDVQDTGYFTPEHTGKFAAHRSKMKRALLAEGGEEMQGECKRRRKSTSTSTKPSPRKVEGMTDKDWRAGNCSAARAMLWISEHPEGQAIADRWLDMTNQPEWTPSSARMLFRRWRERQIDLRKVLLLSKILSSRFHKISMRYLLENYDKVINDSREFTLPEKLVVGRRCHEFFKGDDTSIRHDREVAAKVLSSLAEQDRLSYQGVFEDIVDTVPRYALVLGLWEAGREDIIKEFQQRRTLEIECEMTQNASVWRVMHTAYKHDPELFFYCDISHTGLRSREAMMLRQECAHWGMTVDTAMAQYTHCYGKQ